MVKDLNSFPKNSILCHFKHEGVENNDIIRKDLGR